MSNAVTTFTGNRFYKAMGIVMLSLVLVGFGAAALVRGLNPTELPALFHIHALAYIGWFGLFIYQASLIGRSNRTLHITLGKLSLALVVTMLVTGWLMAKGSFARGVSPIPDISIQQFTAFPLFDLLGLAVFYSVALAKRSDAEFHKRAMLLALVAIMDPAMARIGMGIGFPPFPLIGSLLLIAAVMWHDRRVLHRVHLITWFGFAWVFLRLSFVFGLAATDEWAGIANVLFS